MIDFKKLVSKYDCFAWVPTIRGALSLNLITDSENVLGDVDKYAFEIKNYDHLRSEHYIIASSLHTVNDSKVGNEYARTFRYIFTGVINNVEKNRQFLCDHSLNDGDCEWENYFSNSGLLLGRLTIVANAQSQCGGDSNYKSTHTLTNNEAILLRTLKKLKEKSTCYNRAFINADSMKQLASLRKQMVELWEKAKKCVCDIEKDEKEKRPIFCFDILLTRDGILLIRDETDNEYKNSYAEPNTEDDYTQHIPIHRIFKTSMNYIKYLFHLNYHHNEEHDAYLPASNLYPIKEGEGNIDLTRVFRHQLDAFLFPIVKRKRNRFRDYSIDPQGVILYAQSFVNVFKYNNLVDEKTTNMADDFIKLQKEEICYLMKSHDTILSHILSQNNLIVITTGVLAFITAVLSILSTFLYLPTIKISEISADNRLFFKYVALVILLAIIAYSMFNYTHSKFLKAQFKPKSKKIKLYWGDSNLERKKFSYVYVIYIMYNSCKLWLDRKWKIVTNVITAMVSLIALFIGVYYIFTYLLM